MIEFTWFNTNYGYRHVHIHRNINEGWNDYITKFNTSDDEVDAIKNLLTAIKNAQKSPALKGMKISINITVGE
jgi:hypothetical protein